MSSLAIGAITFACMLGGAILGAVLRRLLPDRQLHPDARDVVKLAAGLIATMAALVLGLMVSSAKNTYDSVNEGLMQNAANLAYFDRILAQYGPETKDLRDKLRNNVAAKIERIWPTSKGDKARVSEEAASQEDELVGDMLRKLTPQDESQRILKGVALQVYGDSIKLRWSLIHQLQASIPAVFMIVLVFWFTVLFAVFALLSPGGMTVNVVMVVCALSVTGGIVLTLDMNRPFEGFVRVSSGPLENALKYLGR